MTATLLDEARALGGEMAAWRAAFHREPEPGNGEYHTAARIGSILDGLGIPHRRMLDTAVAARLDGGSPGPCVALRADMDALPVREVTDAPFASQVPGMMHACGHDVHMAALLGAAKLLAARRTALAGSVVFLFQPDEEGSGGAERLISAGALDGVDAVFGAHVSPGLEAGHVGVRPGKFYAASDVFSVTVRGRSAHGAEREKGIDALAAACSAVNAVLALPARLGNERSVVSVGVIRSGTAGNVVADRAEFSGIIRTLGAQARGRMRRLLEETVRREAAAFGAGADVDLRPSYPGVVNDGPMTGLVREAALGLLGEARVHDLPEPTMTTEDFGYYLDVCPGSFWHFGAGCPLPLHSSGFLPSDEAAVTAAAVHAAVALRALETLPDKKRNRAQPAG